MVKLFYLLTSVEVPPMSNPIIGFLMPFYNKRGKIRPLYNKKEKLVIIYNLLQ